MTNQPGLNGYVESIDDVAPGRSMTDEFTIVAGSRNLRRVQRKRRCLFDWSDDIRADVGRIHDSRGFTDIAVRRAITSEDMWRYDRHDLHIQLFEHHLPQCCLLRYHAIAIVRRIVCF